MKISPLLPICLGFVFVVLPPAAIRSVGPGQAYSRIEAAYTAAQAGDTILVHPRTGDSAYTQVAVYMAKRKIAIQGVATGGARVKLDGRGYDYSGSGSVPRAMFQFNAGSDSSLVENFEISGCTNASYNGAGFRNNQANHVTVRNCDIHGNDMGIMANGSASAGTAANFLIENCVIHENGNLSDPGYNHNLYLGGTSVTLRGCDVYGALTGHNVKSRAHLTILEGCFIHGSANRELDLVDEAGNTDIPGSHAFLRGCVIAKDPACSGNRTVIHFGQDGSADHNGTIFLDRCTIVTPFTSAVVDLSSLNAGARFWNSLIVDLDGNASGQNLVSAGRNGSSLANSGGHHLWTTSGFSVPAAGAFSQVTAGGWGLRPSFLEEANGDYRLTARFAGVVDAGAIIPNDSLPATLRGLPLLTFTPPLGSRPLAAVNAPDIGACEWDTGSGVSQASPFHFGSPRGLGMVRIFDARGHVIRTLPPRTAGPVTWDRKDWAGRTVDAGIYLLVTGEKGRTQMAQKLALIR